MQAGRPSSDHPDDLIWPKLAFATAVPTPYQIFQLKKNAPYSKRRFYELVKLYHPDRNGYDHSSGHVTGLSGATKMERYRLVVAANDILSDPAKRRAYDSTGAGWDGRPEFGAQNYHWGQTKEAQWSGFDTNDSPFRNATWEDWEKWYQRNSKEKQEPVYFSNGGFLSLVVVAVFLGGFGQTLRVEDYSNVFQRQVEATHNSASKAIRQRRMESQAFSDRDQRLQNFLRSRDPVGYGVVDPREDGFRKMLPEPETCLSEGIHQSGQNHDRKPDR